ncbi:MAG: cation transporter [Gammaproteobacteria bacterium]|nr:cation transporter [Gammaproteobacteria bacterium]
MSSQHHRQYNPSSKNSFIFALLLTVVFAVVEVLTGWFSGSLTMLGDAGHMVSDSVVLGLAAFATWMAARPPSKSHSYGMGRAEVLAAWFSSMLMLIVLISLAIEAIDRFHKPEHVAGLPVMIVAVLGLLVNLVVAWILSRGEKTLNSRAAVLHVITDILGSIAALISGTVIYFTGWTTIDPILSLFICVLILFSALRLLRESFLVLMEGVPKHLSIGEVKKVIANEKNVVDVTDLHIWTLTSGMVLLSAHIKIADLESWPQILHNLTVILDKKFDIQHVTLQPELL